MLSDGEPAEMQCIVVAEAEIDHFISGSRRKFVEIIEKEVEGSHAARRGEPVRESQRIIGEPVQR